MFELPKYGRGPCLARVDALLDACGVDRARLASRSIVVTGSNGKGSTCAMLRAMAPRVGLRAGVFTSPHLVRVNERLNVDGEDITDAALDALVREVTAVVRTLEPRFGPGAFGAFEAQFVAAALWFQRNDVDLCVFEAGIGGRLDPTRLAGALVTALTSVDLEHTALLGDSRELIALDKCDACAPGGVTVCAEGLDELEALLRASARLRAVTLRFAREELPASDLRVAEGALRFSLGPMRDLETSLLGRYQARNAACAALALRAWRWRAGRPMSDDELERALREGLRDARWPGRLEAISRDPLCVIDVGHTPDAVAMAADGLFEAHGSERWLLVAGVSSDKRAEEIVRALGARFDRVLCAQARHKGRDVDELAALFTGAVEREEDLTRAVARARAIAAAEGRRLYVAGGLFLAVEFAHAWRGGAPGALRFF